MRIANHRSTNVDLATLLGNSIGQSGESFSLLLANASAQSSQSPKGNANFVSLFTLPVNDEPQTKEQAIDTEAAESDASQSDVAAGTGLRTNRDLGNVPTLVLPMQSRAAASVTLRVPVKDDRPQMSATALAAKIAATVILPPVALIASSNVAIPAVATQPAPAATQLATVDQAPAQRTAKDAVTVGTGSSRGKSAAAIESSVEGGKLPVETKASDRQSESESIGTTGTTQPVDAKTEESQIQSFPVTEAPITPQANARTRESQNERELTTGANATPSVGIKALDSQSEIESIRETGSTQLAGAMAEKSQIASEPVAETATARPMNVKPQESENRSEPARETGKLQPDETKAEGLQNQSEPLTASGDSSSNPSPTSAANAVLPANPLNERIAENLSAAQIALPQIVDIASAATSSAAPSGKAQSPIAANAPEPAPATGNAKNSPGTVSQASSPDPAAHSASNASATPVKAQADDVPAGAAAAKPADPGVAQVQTISAPHTSDQPAASSSREGVAATASHATDQVAEAQATAVPPSSGINAARVIQNMSESEMRVGMHSAEFGDISIRTSVSQQQMVAQISVDHGDLGRAISAHIPSMQEKLGGELGVRALVEVGQSGMSFSSESGSSQDRQMKSGTAQAQSVQTPAEAEEQSARESVWTTAAVAGQHRLDIRA